MHPNHLDHSPSTDEQTFSVRPRSRPATQTLSRPAANGEAAVAAGQGVLCWSFNFGPGT